jgi:hypothetical protein
MQGAKINVRNIDMGKVREQIGDTLPPDVVQSIAGTLADVMFPAAASSTTSSRKFKNPVEAEVGEYIWSRIQALGKSGRQFEDGVEYINDERDADDARDIVQGVDPALRSGSAAGGSFSARRCIQVERRHWIACKQGHYMTQYGIAYVHTNGAVAMFQHGRPTQCRCGALHMA